MRSLFSGSPKGVHKMYKNNFVLAVKNEDGQVLRETTDQTVSLPYESTYCIFLKNKNNRAAGVELSIDGEDILSGEKIIVPANGNIDLERFIKEGAGADGNKFKFAKPTKERISGKKKREIGKIIARFYLEKSQQDAEKNSEEELLGEIKKELDKIKDRNPPYIPVPYPYPVPVRPTYRRWWEKWPYEPPYWNSPDFTYTISATTESLYMPIWKETAETSWTSSSTSFCSSGENSCDTLFLANESSNSDLSGITIEGDESDQDVDMDEIGELSKKFTEICLTIKPSVKALTVSKTKKKYCSNCGSVNKNVAKFCINCGNKLEK